MAYDPERLGAGAGLIKAEAPADEQRLKTLHPLITSLFISNNKNASHALALAAFSFSIQYYFLIDHTNLE
ncbi:hypothetical protein [Bacillus sp. OV322]|uniref:hypothetical protein n=1 Tax=Bacillus sp. OV322 TaxID=1882764 RepID=UPI000B841D35|nr:hypothetical protein [Bacillus sp. OV322]